MIRSLLPADSYIVLNKTVLTEYDKKLLIAFYEPICGAMPISLYLTLWQDLDDGEMFSPAHNHHHLMAILKADLNTIKKARTSLEALGLLKSFYKEGEINEYLYELYSPLLPNEFFNHPILNVVLYNNIGASEYEKLKSSYQKVRIDTKNFTEVTASIEDVYKTTSYNMEIALNDDAIERKTANIEIKDRVDFDTIIASIPKDLINEKAFNKKTRELINMISFLYNIDTIKMIEFLRNSINEFGMIDKNTLRLTARKYYQFNNNSLPTLVYRTQPEYLKSASGDQSMRGKIIAMFENTSPFDFLKNKNKGVNPTLKERKLIESLLYDLELTPAVVNVLIDYVLRKNNNKLTNAYVETIASQWKRENLKTAKEAMEFAEKEHKKLTKKASSVANNSAEKKMQAKEPVWFNEKLEKENISSEEEEELNELLKEFK